jgi:hypothetical protein
MKKRLALLGCMVPDLRDVHFMMPDTLASRKGADVNGGPNIKHFMIIAPSLLSTSISALEIPNARSLLMSCNVRLWARASVAYTSLMTRTRTRTKKEPATCYRPCNFMPRRSFSQSVLNPMKTEAPCNNDLCCRALSGLVASARWPE